MTTVKLHNARNFASATLAIRSGDYDKARELVKTNPGSDQRIIEERIEKAMEKQNA